MILNTLKKSTSCTFWFYSGKYLSSVVPARTFWKNLLHFSTQFEISNVSFFHFFHTSEIFFFKIDPDQLKNSPFYSFWFNPEKINIHFLKKKNNLSVFHLCQFPYDLPRMSAGNQFVQRRCSVLIFSFFWVLLVSILDKCMPLTSIGKHQHIQHWLKFFLNFQTKYYKKNSYAKWASFVSQFGSKWCK